MFSKLLSALALAACLSAGAITTTSAADNDAVSTKADPAHDCIACGKPMAGTPKMTTVDGTELNCCGDACMAKVKANPQYYKGMHDGEMRMEANYVGPKGGDSRKSIPGVGSPN